MRIDDVQPLYNQLTVYLQQLICWYCLLIPYHMVNLRRCQVKKRFKKKNSLWHFIEHLVSNFEKWIQQTRIRAVFSSPDCRSWETSRLILFTSTSLLFLISFIRAIDSFIEVLLKLFKTKSLSMQIRLKINQLSSKKNYICSRIYHLSDLNPLERSPFTFAVLEPI